MDSGNIAALAEEMARNLGDTPAIIEPSHWDAAGSPRHQKSLSFRQLQESIVAGARGLFQYGIKPGQRVAVMIRPGIDFVQVVYSLFRLGATVVAVDPGLGVRGIGRCLQEAEPSAFIGITKAQIARVLFGWGRKTIQKTITTGNALFGATWKKILAQGSKVQSNDFSGDNTTAAILFTSGSTGAAKGVVYEHSHFHAQARHLAETYSIQPGEVDFPTFPLFSLFGPALGMTSILPEMDFSFPAKADPWKLERAIRHYQVTNLFASPALLRQFSLLPEEFKFPSVKRVLSAGAPVSAREIAALVPRLSTPAQVHTPYGATEALPVASFSSNCILGETAEKTKRGHGVCVGRPVNATEVRIIKITDDPIPTWSEDLLLTHGEVGEIVVRGEQVTRSYFNRPVNDSLAKIPHADGAILHRMGDLGYLDVSGRLWFSGRKSQRVQAKGKLFHTVHCEGIFDALPGVRKSALVGIGLWGEQKPLLCVEKEEGGPPEEELARTLLQTAGEYQATAGIGKVLFHPGFPMDVRHNSKINREQLAQWAQGQLP